MAHRAASIIVMAVVCCSTAFGQGADTPTAASDEEGTEAIEIGVGTTAATTTGSSGPSVRPGQAAAGRYSCYNVSQPADYERCFRAEAGPRPGPEGRNR